MRVGTIATKGAALSWDVREYRRHHGVADKCRKILRSPTGRESEGVDEFRRRLPGTQVKGTRDPTRVGEPLQGDTGDKGPNTHWVHGENIEITVNI